MQIGWAQHREVFMLFGKFLMDGRVNFRDED